MCTDCDLYKTSPLQITGSGPAPCDVMIITDAPTTYEIVELKPGATNKWLVRELDLIGLDITNVYFTYAVKCLAPKRTKAQLKACKPRLLNEIARVNPKYILTLGADALYTLTGKTAITKVRGEIINWEGKQILPVYHPAGVLYKPEDLPVFRADLYYFKRMVDGDWDDLQGFKWRIVTSREDREAFMRAVYTSKITAYDIETTSLKNTDENKLLMIGVATDTETYLFPWEHPAVKNKPKNFPEEIIQWYFEHASFTVAQNAKFDNRWLRTRGIDPHVDFDTYLAAYTLNNTLPHGLKYLAKVEFGAKNYDAGIEFNDDFPFKQMAQYCALDCYYTRKLYPILEGRLKYAR